VVIVKTCIKCKQEFTATLEFFHKKGKYLRSSCKKCAKVNDKSWQKANPEKKKANDKARYLANREKAKANSRAWYLANCEKKKATQKTWKLANPEPLAASKRRRRAKRLGNGFEKYTLKEIFETYGTNCYLCDMPINYEAPRQAGKPGWRSGLHIEHFIDIALGGSDTIENVRPSHAWCNLTKGSN